jgi:hypothetical protein
MAWMPAASVTLPSPGRVKLISIFIVTALVLQFLAVLLRTGPWLYPFINYPMYATAHYEGDRISYEYTVYATFDDGTEGAFKSVDLDSSPAFFGYWVKAMVTMFGDSYTLGDQSAAWAATHPGIRRWLKDTLGSNEKASRRFIDVFTRRIEVKTGKTVVALRVEDAPVVLTKAGFVDADGPEVVKTLKINRP